MVVCTVSVIYIPGFITLTDRLTPLYCTTQNITGIIGHYTLPPSLTLLTTLKSPGQSVNHCQTISSKRLPLLSLNSVNVCFKNHWSMITDHDLRFRNYLVDEVTFFQPDVAESCCSALFADQEYTVSGLTSRKFKGLGKPHKKVIFLVVRPLRPLPPSPRLSGH